MNWLLIDVGTTALKAAVVKDSGTVLASAQASYPIHTADDGWAEQEAMDWWQALLSCAQALDLTSVSAIGITGQMQDLILLDNNGQLQRKVILYSDTRATKQAEHINSLMRPEQLMDITGNEQTAASLLAKLRWLKDHEAENFSDTVQLLVGAADYLIFTLTGQFVSDSSTASTTGLMSLATRTWCDDSFFTSLGLPGVHQLLPRLVPGGSKVGYVHTRGQDDLGIKQAIPVFIGPGDAVATSLGMGSGDPQRPYAYLGTSGWVAFSSDVRGDAQKGIFNLAHPLEDKLVCIAPLLTAGATIDWIKTITGAEDYDSMIARAMSKAPSNIVFLPYLQGERSPFYDPSARACFIGLAQHHDQDDLIRAVLEGLVFAYKDALDSLIGPGTVDLGFTGGGSQSPDLCQLFADITGMTVGVPEDASFTGLHGTLFACLQEYGKRPSLAELFTPRQEQASHYAMKYQAFKQGYQQLKPLFHLLADHTLSLPRR